MTTTRRSDGPNGRRRFLALVGAGAIAATAGCTGDANEPDSEGTTDDDGGNGGGTDPDGTEAAASCDDLRGSPTAFDPPDRAFPYLFEYPDTFEEYNSEINESSSSIGAQFGHAESAESASYPVNVVIRQHKGATDDDAAANNWVTSFGSSDRLDWTLAYEGETIEGYELTAFDDPASAAWRFLLPAHETDGVRGVHVQFQDDRDDSPCFDEVATIARDVLESLTPNSDYP
ncbi:hypothetical protein [Natrinema salaciae]|uniref:Uncharacterized protein n=1 Tax=Natrinema salaciae TaxID=1186196 RepID=A0A1H9K4W4_9EURY|nr:hypothetical protein [Natrinema salaciae]SEQ94286.1 hypothetical protein SAMN04489841_2807 [Natrinema salaciae]